MARPKKIKQPKIDIQIQYLQNTINTAEICKTVDPFCEISSTRDASKNRYKIVSSSPDLYQKVNKIDVKTKYNYNYRSSLIVAGLAYNFIHNNENYTIHLTPQCMYVATINYDDKLLLAENQLRIITNKVKKTEVIEFIVKEIFMEYVKVMRKNKKTPSFNKDNQGYYKIFEKYINII